MSDNCGLTVILDRNQRGDVGATGLQGETGDSAYDIAVQRGFEGDYDAWLASLKGDKGDKGEASTVDGTDLGSAAFKDAGTGNGNVPVYSGGLGVDGAGYNGTGAETINWNDVSQKTGTYRGIAWEDEHNPFGAWAVRDVRRFSADISVDTAVATTKPRVAVRYNNDGMGEWNRVYTQKDPIIYDTTTAAGANVVVSSTGELQRSTSSMRYKQLLGALVLNDDNYQAAMQLEPIIYRSTAPADNPKHHYYSFSAEALGEYDPAFVFWRNTEQVETTTTDDDGNEITTSETVALDKPQAEGININALLASQAAVDVYQGKLIADLIKRVADLETALANK